MTNKKITLAWEDETNKLVEIFVNRYFYKGVDWYWVGNEVGFVLCVNDYFFNLSHILTALRFNCSDTKLFEFYDLELEHHTNGKDMPINFENFIKYGLKPLETKK